MNSSSAASSAFSLQAGALALAVAGPPLLCFSAPPSPTLLNQVMALALWAWVLTTLALDQRAAALLAACRSGAALLAALGLVALAALGSAGLGSLPWPLALGPLGTLAAALLVALAGSLAARHQRVTGLVAFFLLGLLLSGVLSALIAFVQVFAPTLPDGNVVAFSGLVRRAVGNLRQPNHLASLLVWSVVALAALVALGRVRLLTGALLLPLLVGAVVLTGSRTGMLDMALLAVWALLDKRLPRPARQLLLAAPAVYALAWLAFDRWEAAIEAANVAAGAAPTPPRRGDISSSRFAIWSNTLKLIAQHPLLGVGFGEFNFAWTLSVFPDRPVAFFDHVHNLPLQLAVELGLPLAAAVLGLLAWALWQSARRVHACHDEAGLAGRFALALVLLILVHSLLEYPLWYAYFLLPTAWAFGLVLGLAPTPPATAASAEGQPNAQQSGPAEAKASAPELPLDAAASPWWPGVAAGLVMLAGAGYMLVDYVRVVVIYAPPANARPLVERIERGQHSPLFGHHADYAAMTTGDVDAAAQALAMRRAPHHLLDVRLMEAWAKTLAERGQVDRARYLAARLREFRNPGSAGFFAGCTVGDAAQKDFQCQAPQQAHGWREFTAP